MPYVVGKAFFGPEGSLQSGDRIEGAVALSWRNLDALVSGRYLRRTAPDGHDAQRPEGRKGR